MVSAFIDLISAAVAGWMATEKLDPDSSSLEGFAEVLAALLGLLNLGFFVWGLDVAARESTAHTDDDYEVFVAIRNTSVRRERRSGASTVATVATGTRVFVRPQRASFCCRPALSISPPMLSSLSNALQSQVWEQGDDFKTGEVKLRIERSSDSVTVTVCECQQLQRMDGLTSKNDAYVVVTLNDLEPQRTPTIENENNPNWDESDRLEFEGLQDSEATDSQVADRVASNALKFDGIDKIHKLVVVVFDEDKEGQDDDEIGSVTLVSEDGQIDPGVLGLDEKERSGAWAHPESRWFLLQREDSPREEGDVFPVRNLISWSCGAFVVVLSFRWW